MWPQRARDSRERKFMTQPIMWLEFRVVVIVVSIENILTNSRAFITIPRRGFYPTAIHFPIEINLMFRHELPLNFTGAHKVAITSVLSGYHFWNYFTIFQAISRHLSHYKCVSRSWFKVGSLQFQQWETFIVVYYFYFNVPRACGREFFSKKDF